MGMSLLGGGGNYIELYNKCDSLWTLTATAGTKPFTNSIVIPSDIAGTIKEAYIDLLIAWMDNQFAGANKIAGAQVIRVDNSLVGGWTTCTTIPSNSLYMSAQAILPGQQWFFGDVDVVAKALKGETLDFEWQNAEADQNNIQCRNVGLRLRLIMG